MTIESVLKQIVREISLTILQLNWKLGKGLEVFPQKKRCENTPDTSLCHTKRWTRDPGKS